MLTFARKLRKSSFLAVALAGCLVLSLAIGVVASHPAMAAKKTSELTPIEQAKAFAYKEALKACLTSFNGENAMTIDQANEFNLVYARKTKKVIGFINDPSDGVVLCGGDEGAAWLREAATLWGYSSALDLFCDIGFTRSAGDCRTGSGNYLHNPKNGGEAINVWWGNLGNRTTNEDAIRESGGLYLLYKESFFKACEPQENGNTYRVYTYGEDGNWSEKWYGHTEARGPGHRVRVTEFLTLSCGQLAEMIDQETDAAVQPYKQWTQDHGGQAGDQQSGQAAEAGAEDEANNSCVVEGLGWIVCPFALLTSSIVDSIYGFIENGLRVQPLQTDMSRYNAIYNTWSFMTNIANVLFIISFLIIIFSHLTNLGINNYTVKKLLPRLVITAVLVNVSYWLSAIAIDLSNIIGSSLYDLLAVIRNNMNVNLNTNWGNVLTAILAGTSVAAAVGVAGVTAAASVGTLASLQVLIYLALPMLVAALIAILLAVFIIVARQALITVLVIVAPIAFAAFLLPNTEKFFNIWRKSFITMLVFYPLLSIIFGMSQIAGLAIMGLVAQGADDPFESGLFLLLGLAVQVVPLAITPLLVQFSGGLISRFAGMLRQRGGGWTGALRNFSRTGARRQASSAIYNRPRKTAFGNWAAGQVKRFDQFRARGSMLDQQNASEKQSAITSRLARDRGYAIKAAGGSLEGAESLIEIAQRKEVEEGTPLFERKFAEARRIASAEGKEFKVGAWLKEEALQAKDDTVQFRIVVNKMTSMGMDSPVRFLIDNNKKLKVDVGQIEASIQQFSAAMKPKAPDLVKGGPTAGFTGLSLEDYRRLSDSGAASYNKWLKGLQANAANAKVQAAANPSNQAFQDNYNQALASFNKAIEQTKTIVGNARMSESPDIRYNVAVDLHNTLVDLGEKGMAKAISGSDYFRKKPPEEG